MTNADWRVDKEMLSKLMKTVSRLEEDLKFRDRDSFKIVSQHCLPRLLNLPVCKSTMYICAHRHI